MIMEKGKDLLKHTQWKHHCVTHLKDVTELRRLAVHVLLFKS